MRRSIAVVLCGLALGAGLVSLAHGLLGLVVGLFLLRLCGQGLAGHLAVVAAARYARRRGRAVAMVSYGFILGEAMLPALVALGMESLSWRGVWLLAALITIGVALPVLVWLAWPLTHPRVLRDAETSAVSPAVMTRRKLFT